MSTKVPTALITGASRGIGRAISRRLAKKGFAVAIADLPSQERDGKKLVYEIESHGAKATFIPTDVTVKGQLEEAVDVAHKTFNSFNVMINNAGVLSLNPIDELTSEELHRMWNVNVNGTLFGMQAAAAKFRQLGVQGGKIINACSLAGQIGPPIMGGYSSTKFAIKALTQSAAHEYGKDGITVNSFCPGPVETGMLDEIVKKTIQYGLAKDEKEVRFQQYGRSALRRSATPEDIAKFVSFLATEESDFVTGQSIMVDGGIYCH